eukprot:3124445-Amphidinium_carterae.1
MEPRSECLRAHSLVLLWRVPEVIVCELVQHAYSRRLRQSFSRCFGREHFASSRYQVRAHCRKRRQGKNYSRHWPGWFPQRNSDIASFTVTGTEQQVMNAFALVTDYAGSILQQPADEDVDYQSAWSDQ